VSALPTEGQFLPEVKEVMRRDPWNPDSKLPWKKIKNVWDNYWDQEKPLLLEKSPPNIIRTKDIVKHFSPVYFILMVRNPYAFCEGLIRRNNWSSSRAVCFAVRCLRQQVNNSEKLTNALCFTYEELVANPESISQRIRAFIPQVGALDHNKKMKVHSIDGAIERGIVDLNKKKITNLSPKQLGEINKVLNKNAEVMDYWGYEYYKPSLRHTFSFAKTRSRLFLSKMFSKGWSVAGKTATELTKRST
jgi:hypothetical protein